MGKIQDLTGQRFGRLTVIGVGEKPPESKRRRTYWLCTCECGKTVAVASDKLIRGDTKSCGCLKSELATERIKKYGKPHKTHGKSGTRLYNIYNHMKRRCYDARCAKYIDYGARGIIICNEWLNSFENFYDWAILNGYAENLSIDRIDVNGNYCPENCRWASDKTQANNKRSNKVVSVNGENFTLAQLRDKTGIPIATLSWRLSHGWSGEQLLVHK